MPLPLQAGHDTGPVEARAPVVSGLRVGQVERRADARVRDRRVRNLRARQLRERQNDSQPDSHVRSVSGKCEHAPARPAPPAKNGRIRKPFRAKRGYREPVRHYSDGLLEVRRP